MDWTHMHSLTPFTGWPVVEVNQKKCTQTMALTARLCDSALWQIVKLGMLIHSSHLNHLFHFLFFSFLFLNFLLSSYSSALL